MEERVTLRESVKEKSFGYISAALGLVAGLAWNDAIKALIDSIYPNSGGGVAAKFIYAGIVTIAIVIAITYLEHLSKKK